MVDKDLEFDVILPDHCPDIARLIKVDCTPFCESSVAEDGKAIVKGKAIFDVLYETDYKSKLKFCSFKQEFTNSVNVPRSDSNEIFVDCDAKCASVGCKLLSPRRIILKATLGTRFNIEGESGIKALSVNEDEETFFLKKAVGFNGKTSVKEEIFRFNDSLSLNQSEKAIGEIVCGSITLQEPQLVLTPGRVEVKTSAAVHALCEEEDSEGKYFMSVKNLPVSFDYENDAIEEHKQIKIALEVLDSDFSPETDQYGENRIIKTDFGVKMKLKLNEPKAYTVASDVFEKGFDSIPVMSKAMLPHLSSQSEMNFSVETKLSEITPKPTRILEATARDYGSVTEKTEDGVNVSGNFTLTLVTDTAEGIHSRDFSVPYSQAFALEYPDAFTEIVADTYPIEALVTLHPDGSATARIIAGVKLYAYSETEETFVSDVSKRTPKESADSDSALVYCFPERNENVWSIAKLYRVDPEIILKANQDSFDENGKATEPLKPILIKI